MTRYDYDQIEDERAELLAERNRYRIYTRRFVTHPNCDDPDHPGCSDCIEEKPEDDEE